MHRNVLVINIPHSEAHLLQIQYFPRYGKAHLIVAHSNMVVRPAILISMMSSWQTAVLYALSAFNPHHLSLLSPQRYPLQRHPELSWAGDLGGQPRQPRQRHHNKSAIGQSLGRADSIIPLPRRRASWLNLDINEINDCARKSSVTSTFQCLEDKGMTGAGFSNRPCQ